MLWRTRDFSVRNSKDLIMRRVRVADVFGMARFVRTSEISPDMVEENIRRNAARERCDIKAKQK